MRSLLLAAVIGLSVCAGVSRQAQATVLDFEGLTSSSAARLPANYGGFSWDSAWWLYNDQTYPVPAHSGTYAILNNAGASPVGFSSSSPFEFNGVWMAGWNSNAPGQIDVIGYDAGGAVVGSVTTDIVAGQLTYVTANFAGVERVSFVGGHFFTLDDVTVNADPAAVPEPATLAVFGAGLAGLGMARLGMARRRRAGAA